MTGVQDVCSSDLHSFPLLPLRVLRNTAILGGLQHCARSMPVTSNRPGWRCYAEREEGGEGGRGERRTGKIELVLELKCNGFRLIDGLPATPSDDNKPAFSMPAGQHASVCRLRRLVYPASPQPRGCMPGALRPATVSNLVSCIF